MAVEPLIRRARPADLGILRAIDAAVRPAVSHQRGGEAWLAAHVPLSEWTDGDLVSRTMVGAIDEEVVGYAVWEIVDDSRRGRIVRVERIHVVPEARELGFGDALLAGILDLGRRDGCVIVEAEALPGDRETKNLYERAGITARNIVVSKRLVD